MRVQMAEAGEDVNLKVSVPAAPVAAPAQIPSDGESLEGTGFALLNAGVAAAERREPKATPQAAPAIEADPEPQSANVAPGDRRHIDDACREPLARLVEELSLCRRYFESAFHDQPVQRLIFLGGEANQRGLCQQIAREMGIAAQIGDPLCRMSKHTLPGVETGIDRRVPQPAWTVAIGLSMGPVAADQTKSTPVETETRASR
jgi:hypothetical protein